MALADTFVRQVKPTRPAGDKHADGGGMYLLVKGAGKYRRLDYRYLTSARRWPWASTLPCRWPEPANGATRKLLAEGIDPSQAKRDDQHAKTAAAGHTFQAITRHWLHNTQAERAESTQQKNASWLEKNIFPEIGAMQIAAIKPRDVLAALRKVEARGTIESAHKIKQLCGQVFRFAVASGLAERDVTADLRDALAAVPGTHYAAITDATRQVDRDEYPECQ